MARRSYKKRRYYRKKGIWSSRITNFSFNREVSATSSFEIITPLTSNPQQSDTGISQKFTAKNINLQFMLEGPNNSGGTVSNAFENVQIFVIFVPQGYVLSSNTPYEHPEWIMSYKYVGIPVTQNDPGYGPIKVFSRLARKLDTGDGISLLIIGSNTSSGGQTIKGSGVIRYNTKAN